MNLVVCSRPVTNTKQENLHLLPGGNADNLEH